MGYVSAEDQLGMSCLVGRMFRFGLVVVGVMRGFCGYRRAYRVLAQGACDHFDPVNPG